MTVYLICYIHIQHVGFKTVILQVIVETKLSKQKEHNCHDISMFLQYI